MTKRIENTEFGEIQFDTVECDSCLREVPKNDTWTYKLEISRSSKGSPHPSCEWIDPPKLTVCEFCQEEGNETAVELYENHYHTLRSHRDRLKIDRARMFRLFNYQLIAGVTLFGISISGFFIEGIANGMIFLGILCIPILFVMNLLSERNVKP